MFDMNCDRSSQSSGSARKCRACATFSPQDHHFHAIAPQQGVFVQPGLTDPQPAMGLEEGTGHTVLAVDESVQVLRIEGATAVVGSLQTGPSAYDQTAQDDPAQPDDPTQDTNPR